MPMVFGDKRKNIDDSTGDYLRNFKKGDTVVRFLEEVDEWFGFREHYTRDRKSFPCTQDRETCPGCTSEDEDVQRAGRKYATNVLLTKEKKVLPMRIPVGLADKMQTRSDRNGKTILNRDYVVIKQGSGLETTYDVDQEDKYDVDIAASLKEGQDVQEILQASYDAIWGEEAQDKAKARAKSRKEEDEPPTEPKGKRDEPAGDETFTEDQIREMTRPELVKLFDKANLEVDPDDSRSEMVEKLLAKFADA